MLRRGRGRTHGRRAGKCPGLKPVIRRAGRCVRACIRNPCRWIRNPCLSLAGFAAVIRRDRHGEPRPARRRAGQLKRGRNARRTGARSCHPRRTAHGRARRRAPGGGHRGARRADRRDRQHRAGRGRRDRRARQDRHARVRRHPYALRRADHLEFPPGPVQLARRDHGGDGQLRGRVRAGARGRSRQSDRADGRRGGHPGRGAARRPGLGLGNVSRLPAGDRTDRARHRLLRATAARGAARVCHGRTRAAAGNGHARRHRADARPGGRGHTPWRHRVLDLALDQSPFGHRRSDAVAARGRGRVDRHRPGTGGRRRRRAGDHHRFRRSGPAGGRVRHDAPPRGKVRPAAVVLADAKARQQRGVAAAAGPDGAGGGRRPAHPGAGRAARGGRAAGHAGQPQRLLGLRQLQGHRRPSPGRAGAPDAGSGVARATAARIAREPGYAAGQAPERIRQHLSAGQPAVL